MTTHGLCKRISRGRAHDVVWQQIQYPGDDLLHLSRNFRPLGRELCVTFSGELGHTAKVQSPRRHSKAINWNRKQILQSIQL